MFEFLYKAREARERSWFKSAVAAKKGVDWSDNLVWDGNDLLINAESWRPYTIFPKAPTTPLGGPYSSRYKRGPWQYAHTRLPRGEAISLYQNKKRANVFFTDDVVLPSLYDTLRVWMSITPAELISQRGGVRFAQGKVVVAGLGMGWLLQKICDRPKVKEVVVVERDARLMDWYGNRLCAAQPKVTKVIVDDYWKVAHDKTYADHRHVVDIWPGYGDAKWDDQFQALKKDHKAWGWGDVEVADVPMWG